MKTNFLIFLICTLTTLLACNKDDGSTDADPLNGKWNLTNVRGGIVGVDKDFDPGVIVWTFSSEEGVLVVQNNNGAGGYDGYESGNYNYSVVETNDKTYLNIDDGEVGGLSIVQNFIIINQNERSTGNGADGFVIELKR